ncbi:hypothetical protein KPH14_002683 [Odynerus spinipes]|uniref:Uncharacterized protein n=1 Tax=Odynerus spinipes TaxID=1348599 RepID=A0AAD9VHV7_9HYME|nr:hypothetical protein KPH14_002683 [Odynerus spinipes]
MLCPPWVEVDRVSFSNIGDSFLDLEYTIEEFRFAIQNVRKNSSPGLDGIDYMVLTHLPEEARLSLLRLFNDIFKSGEFPLEWRQYAIFFYTERRKF